MKRKREFITINDADSMIEAVDHVRKMTSDEYEKYIRQSWAIEDEEARQEEEDNESHF